MGASFGEHILENEVKIAFDGRHLDFEMAPHYMILGQTGKAKLHIDLMFEAQSYKYEFEANIAGTQVQSIASLKLSPEVTASMTINVPTFHASEMKLRIVSNGFQKTDVMLNLKTPWTGVAKIFYEHNGQMGKSFNTMGYIEKAGARYAGYSLNTVFSKDYSFDFAGDYENTKIESKGTIKFEGGQTVATLNTKTPFPALKEVLVTAQSRMQKDRPNLKLDVKLPTQEYKLNFDSTDGNFNGLLNLNMDKKNKDKQYKFITTYKNTDQRADVSRSFNLKMIHPQRTVSLDSRFENTQHSMVLSSHLMWEKDQKAGFELMVQKGRGNEGKLRIITPSRTVELFGRFEVNGNHYSTVGHIMMDEKKKAQKVDIKADMMLLSDKAEIDLVVKFPNQKKGMNLKTSINLPSGNIILGGATEFSMDQDPKKTFKISGKIMKETKGNKHVIHTIQMDAKHAQTGFSTEIIGRLASNPEKHNADVEMSYLNSKRQKQKYALRGEMHRHNNEVHMKLEAPSKTWEWNPQILEEINPLGYQKLSLYREKLESFGESLSQMLNDEVSKKFSLAKRSISKEMTPISDYFNAEYKSLSSDFA